MDFTHLKILQYRFSDVLLLLRKIEDNEKTQRKSNKYIYVWNFYKETLTKQ